MYCILLKFGIEYNKGATLKKLGIQESEIKKILRTIIDMLDPFGLTIQTSD